MPSTVKSLSKFLHKIFCAFLSLSLVFLVAARPLLALNDGQQLIIESWNIVNEGFVNQEKFGDIQWKRLRQKALEKQIETSEDAYEAIEAMLLPLGDPYTRLLRPKNYELMKESNLGSEINGVGLQLGARNEDGKIVVICPLEDSPAADAEIISGSILLKVEDESPQALGLEATAAKLRGESGSKVLLELESPNGEIKEISLERRSVDLRPVRTRRIRNENHTLGYLRITQFSEGVPEQVKEALEELQEKGVEGLVLDLRNNSGGLVSSGLAVADAFLSDKPIVETKNRDSISDPIPSNAETIYDGPMVTLVNGGTASASEILAGALQDNDRSQLLGNRTFGKGLIQTLTNLSDGSGLAVTVASYLTPSGRDIQNLGIEPNRYLEAPEPLNPGSIEDRWLIDAELAIEANLDRQNLDEEKKLTVENPDEPMIPASDELVDAK
ncbi:MULTISPECIES: carboxyl-terminal processing protease CtpZ [Prochlorococcus]|uniref:carboxyl-terminal processing protease CtpZ n=1 Tax=Prochlorococcus TaxID=1218 RepID=UPI00053373B6|nr:MULTISPECIES: carboxyl-terminal processing protease CtpZ [Prochlorococcus]KGG13029.1 Periplasmic protease [Prochlorococcus sp. MIT 0601]